MPIHPTHGPQAGPGGPGHRAGKEPAALGGGRPGPRRRAWSGRAPSGARGSRAPPTHATRSTGSARSPRPLSRSWCCGCATRAALELDDPLARTCPSTAARAGDASAQLLAHFGRCRPRPSGPWWERSEGGGSDDLADLVDSAAAVPPRDGAHYSNVGYRRAWRARGAAPRQTWPVVVTTSSLGRSACRARPTARRPAAAGLAVHPWADVLLPDPSDAGHGPRRPALVDGRRPRALGHLPRPVTRRCCRGDTVEEMRVPRRPTTPRGPGRRARPRACSSGRRRAPLAGHAGSMPGFVATLRVDRAPATPAVASRTRPPGVSRSSPTCWSCCRREPPAGLPVARTPGSPATLELLGPWYWGPPATSCDSPARRVPGAR